MINTGKGDEQRRCMNAGCRQKIEELLQVNNMWQKDYNQLLQQNQRLLATLKTTQTSRIKSPDSSLSTTSTTNQDDMRQPINLSTTTQNRLNTDDRTASLPLHSTLSTTAYDRSQSDERTTALPTHSTRSISPIRSAPPARPSNGKQGQRSNNQQQSVLNDKEAYIQCTVASIEQMKEQIRAFKLQYEKEKEEKEKQILKNEKLKRKLTENEDVTFQLHQRIDNLEKKMKREKEARMNPWGTCNCEQQRKAELMESSIFPKNEHGFTGYREERDSMARRYQQHQRQMESYSDQRVEQKHQKFQQIYPLIY